MNMMSSGDNLIKVKSRVEFLKLLFHVLESKKEKKERSKISNC